MNPIVLGVQSLPKKAAHKPCLNCVRTSSRWDAHHHQWASFALKWLGFYLITSSVITLWDNVLDMHEKCGVETLFVQWLVKKEGNWKEWKTKIYFLKFHKPAHIEDRFLLTSYNF